MNQINSDNILNQFNVHSYDNILYESRPVAYNDYVNNKNNIVHQELYEDALNMYINEHISKYINNNFLYIIFTYLNSVMFEDINNVDDLSRRYTDSLYEDLILYPDVKQAISDLDLIYNDYMYFVFNYIISKLFKLVEVVSGDPNPEDVNNYDDFIANLKYMYHIEEETLCQDDNDGIPHLFESESNTNNFLFLLEESETELVYLAYDKNARLYITINPKNEYDHIYDINESLNELSIAKQILSKIDEYGHNIIYYVNQYNISFLQDLQNEAIRLYNKDHNFIEIKNDEYQQPSKVIIMSRISPFRKYKYDLTPVWNRIQYKDDKEISNIKEDSSELDKMYEIIYIDYVNKKVKVQSKITGEEKYISFDYIKDDTLIDDKYQNTFTILHQEILKKNSNINN